MTYWPPHPALEGLHRPPFGLGLEREVRDHGVGTTAAGIPFQAFAYSSSAYKTWAAGMATIRLGLCLPGFFVSLPGHARAGIAGVEIPNTAGLTVVAEDAAYGRAVLDAALVQIVGFARSHPLDLSIDGDSLTAADAPLSGELLRPYCEDLARIATALSTDPGLRAFQVPRDPGVGFYGYPGSVYVPRDDSLLHGAPVTVGDDNKAVDVVAMPPDRGLNAVGFRHTYVTTSYDGTTTTTTRHVEDMVRVDLPFRFGALGYDWRGYGDPIMLFVPQLEKSHQFSAHDNDFAAEVVRPMVDWLLQLSPPPFAVGDRTMWFLLKTQVTPAAVAWCQSFAAQFFEQIPDRVWHRLGLPHNPMEPDLR